MSRASYGADLFSPLRGNTSFNEDSLCIGRESDVLLNDWQEPHSVTGNSGVKKKNLPFFNIDEASSKDVLQSAPKIERVVEKRNKKDSSLETDLNRLSYITTRRSKSSHKSKKDLSIIQENQLSVNDKVSKTRKKNHITVGAEADSNKELLPSKIKHNKHSSSSLVNPSDSNKQLPSNKIKNNKDSSSYSVNIADLNKELLPHKIKHTKDSLLSSVNLADSNKELLPNKIKQNKGSSVSLVDSSDSNKELHPHKIKENKDSSVNFADSIKKISPHRIRPSSPVSSVNSSEGLFSSEVNQDKDSSSFNLASIAFNLDASLTKSENDNLCLSEKQPQMHNVLASSTGPLKISSSKSKKSEKDFKVPVEKCTQIEKPVFTSNYEGDNSKLPQEVTPYKKNQSDLTVTESFDSESTLSNSDSKPKQIQASIIEKLVKDAVSFEFDGIRQMLYLQHLQLLKYMDRNAVNCELQKIIEALLEENTRLRNIIAQQTT